MHNIRYDKQITQEKPFDPQQISFQTHRNLTEDWAQLMFSPISPSHSSKSIPWVELPFRNPFEEDSDTPFEKWSTSISTSALRRRVNIYTTGLFCAVQLLCSYIICPSELKLQWNGSNDRTFLLYYDVHPSVTDLGMGIFLHSSYSFLHFISSCFPWESNPWSWRC